MVKSEIRSEIPGSDDHSWVPTKFDAVPKLINITVLSYSVVIPPDSVVSVQNLVLEADKALEKGSSDDIRRVSYLSDKTLGWKRYLGVLYTLFSTCLLSLSANLLKLLSHINPLTLGTYGFLVAALLSIPFIWYTLKIEKKSVMKNILPLRDNKKVLFFMWFRAVLSITLQYGFVIAFRYITVADTRTIMASSVITINFFGCLCLGEKCGIVPILFAIVALCGILVMTRPPILTGAEHYDENTLIGVSIAFGCLLLVTIIILTLRYLHNVHHGVLNLSLYAWAFFTTLSFAVVYDQWKPPENVGDILTTLGVGITLFFGNMFLSLALQVEEAGVVSLVRTSEVIFTFFWQMIIINVFPDMISLVGAVLVVTGVVVVTLRKFLASLPPESSWRKRLAFLLL